MDHYRGHVQICLDSVWMVFGFCLDGGWIVMKMKEVTHHNISFAGKKMHIPKGFKSNAGFTSNTHLL